VITNDDLDKLITGIAAGRRIYANIKKAIQYIISIHIPIILTVSLPLFLNWIYPHIFTPVHVIFLELIMGPTRSIVYENEPLERIGDQYHPGFVHHYGRFIRISVDRPGWWQRRNYQSHGFYYPYFCQRVSESGQSLVPLQHG